MKKREIVDVDKGKTVSMLRSSLSFLRARQGFDCVIFKTLNVTHHLYVTNPNFEKRDKSWVS